MTENTIRCLISLLIHLWCDLVVTKKWKSKRKTESFYSLCLVSWISQSLEQYLVLMNVNTRNLTSWIFDTAVKDAKLTVIPARVVTKLVRNVSEYRCRNTVLCNMPIYAEEWDASSYVLVYADVSSTCWSLLMKTGIGFALSCRNQTLWMLWPCRCLFQIYL